MRPSATPHLRAFTRTDLPGAIALFAAEGWSTYTDDAERAYRSLSARGSTTLVAVDGRSVVALLQLQSDGEIQAHASALLVAEPWRGHGLGRALLREALKLAGGVRVDVISRAGRYYLSLGGEPVPGFRLNRQDLDVDHRPDGHTITRDAVVEQAHTADATTADELSLSRGLI